MVRPERFELPTLWFEAKCSIQLSYGRGKEGTAVNNLTKKSPDRYVAATGSGGRGVTNIDIFSTMSKPERRRS